MVCTKGSEDLKEKSRQRGHLLGIALRIALLISEGCCSKVPPTGWLKMTAAYCFTVLKAEVQNQVPGNCLLLAREQAPFLAPPSLRVVSPPQPSAPGSITPISPQLSQHLLCVCVQVSLFSKDTSHTGLGLTLMTSSGVHL